MIGYHSEDLTKGESLPILLESENDLSEDVARRVRVYNETYREGLFYPAAERETRTYRCGKSETERPALVPGQGGGCK